MPSSRTSSTHRLTVRDAFRRLMRELRLGTVFGMAMGNNFSAFRSQTPLSTCLL